MGRDCGRGYPTPYRRALHWKIDVRRWEKKGLEEKKKGLEEGERE